MKATDKVLVLGEPACRGRTQTVNKEASACDEPVMPARQGQVKESGGSLGRVALEEVMFEGGQITWSRL